MVSSEMLAKTRVETVEELEKAYLKRADWEIVENANTNFSYSNFRNYLFEKLVETPSVLSSYLPPDAVEAHYRASLHIHKQPDSL